MKNRVDALYSQLLSRTGESEPRPRLEATRMAVQMLGDVHLAAPVIQVAGTNGKTSTARMIDSLLRASGLRVGLLTSPHLVRVTERIVVDGEAISDDAFVAVGEEVTPYLQMVDEQLSRSDQAPLSFFEALTVLAFAAFADAPVDVMVLEVGMGGEWDSTNVANAEVAVFTPIALDHTTRLGNTLGEIARTKSGIIKPLARVVTAMQEISVLDELRFAVNQEEASLYIERVDFACEVSTVAVGGQLLDLRGRAARYPGIFLPLYGAHQAQNAALALAAVESFLGDASTALDAGVVSDAFAGVKSPGRLQLVGTTPSVLVDAAHNPHGVAALGMALEEYFDFAEIGFVVGVLSDKDAHGIIAEFSAYASQVWATRAPSSRAVSASELAGLLREKCEPDIVHQVDGVAEALRAAREWAGAARGRAVVVTGSITLVGAAIVCADEEGWQFS